MPKRPKTPCTTPGCPELVDKPGKCTTHRAEYDRLRGHVWRDYQSPAYRRNRAQALRRKPVCECGQPTVDVDHVIPLRLGGTHAPSNLDPLCKACHSRKTARENGLGR